MALIVTLVKETTTVTLPAPAPGAEVTTARAQAVGTARDGTAYVYDLGVTTQAKTECFDALTAAERSSLLDFFSLVGGQAQIWTYTDSGGTSYSARFATSALSCTRHTPDCWAVTVPLLLDAAAQ